MMLLCTHPNGQSCLLAAGRRGGGWSPMPPVGVSYIATIPVPRRDDLGGGWEGRIIKWLGGVSFGGGGHFHCGGEVSVRSVYGILTISS